MRSIAPKTLSFPLAGVSQNMNYRKPEAPYFSPYACNVRSRCALEGRLRGGSRPGLSAIGTVKTQNRGAWQWPNGEPLLWDAQDSITYTLSEDVLTAPDGTQIVNPVSLIRVRANKGAAPEDYTACCVYRDRVFVASGSMWYASRMGDHSDFDYGADAEDVAKAVAGNVAEAGKKGEPITALIPVHDSRLIIATANRMYLLKGDPADGLLEVLSEETGIIAPYAWARHDGTIVFMSKDGVYVMSGDGYPERFSENRMPEELRSIDVDTHIVLMAYDPVGLGFHLFITPNDGNDMGDYYFIDLGNKAVWPVMFGNNAHQPVAVCRMKNKGIEEVAMLGSDGVWRKFDPKAQDDDGTPIVSFVVLGVILISPNDVDDAVLAELSGVMAAGSGTVTWEIVSGQSAEEAADKAFLGDSEVSGQWRQHRNPVNRPRLRGPWIAVTLQSEQVWAYEAVVMKSRQLGRLRAWTE